jgi:hypothetical protein
MPLDGRQLVLVVLLAGWWGSAEAATLRVPGQHPDIQAAIDAAAPGDEIRVGPGSYCGARIDKQVSLEGHGHPVIRGCDTGPVLFSGLRVGFLMDGSPGATLGAHGTKVSGFTFDGRAISTQNLQPLAFGVFSRFTSDVQIIRNTFLGTVQAITNTGGDRWVIWNNHVRDLTLFDCTGALCGGGVGIAVQTAAGAITAPGGPADPANRAQENFVAGNDVSGRVPDAFDLFSMVGILVLAADETSLWNNRLAIEGGGGAALGEGIVVTNSCCGLPTPVIPGARDTVLVLNDGRRSDLAIGIEGSGGENTQGLAMFGNRGLVQIEGGPVSLAGRGQRRIGPLPGAIGQRRFF